MCIPLLSSSVKRYPPCSQLRSQVNNYVLEESINCSSASNYDVIAVFKPPESRQTNFSCVHATTEDIYEIIN